METKWIMIMVAAAVVAMLGAAAVSDYSKRQCTASLATSTRTAEEIVLLCR